MAISAMGMGSGIDIRSLVDQLVASERKPAQQRLDRREMRVQTQLSAFGALKGALSGFQTQLRSLANVESFGQMRATSSKDDIIGVSASTKAAAGSYQMRVNNLAEAQSVASGGFASRDEVVGGGKLVFRFGEEGEGGFTENPDRASRTIDIQEGATLAQVRDAVNGANIGVQASIINDGSGHRLVFTSKDTGLANGFVIQAQDADGNPNTDPEGLGRLAYGLGATTDMALTRAAADAEVEINGLAVTRASNTISDAIEGVTLDLQDASATQVRIDVSRDTGSVERRVREFVEGFNKLQQNIRELTRYNAETEQASVLTGNSLVRGLNSQLRNLMMSPVGVLQENSVRSLADIGIMTKSDGSLEFNSGRLRDALENNFEEVGALFTSMGLVNDANGVEFLGNSNATEAGSYKVEITQAATQARYIGAAATTDGDGNFVIDAANSLRISVDGTRSATINLRQDTYTPEALAAELQAQINSDADLRKAGATVGVTWNGDGFEIVSSSYGSTSKVEILSSGLPAALGLAAGKGTDEAAAEGKDVAGTINGQAAEGKGRELTGTAGAVEGLKLLISGEQLGGRGDVTFSRGILEGVDRFLDGYLQSNGVIAGTTNGLNSQLREIQRGREALERRMEGVEQRLLKQYTAMDVMVGQLNMTSQYLQQQLSALPGFQGPKKSK